jgi:hypothetical protein
MEIIDKKEKEFSTKQSFDNGHTEKLLETDVQNLEEQ